MSEKCLVCNPVTGSQCQLDHDHETNDLDGGHVFPIDDAFLAALDEGHILIGRPPPRTKKEELARAMEAAAPTCVRPDYPGVRKP